MALVELEEGVRMMTNVVGCPPDEVHVGMAVTVTLGAAAATGASCRSFEPADGAATAS